MDEFTPIPTLSELPAQWEGATVRPEPPVKPDAVNVGVDVPDRCRWCGSADVTAVVGTVAGDDAVLVATRCAPCGLIAVYSYTPDRHWDDECCDCDCACC